MRSASSRSIRKGASEDALTEAALVDGVIDVDYARRRVHLYGTPAQLPARATRCAAALQNCRRVSRRARETDRRARGGELAAALAFLDRARRARRRAARLQQSRRERGSAGGAHLSSDARLAGALRSQYLPRDWVFPDRASRRSSAVLVWFGHQIYEFLLPAGRHGYGSVVRRSIRDRCKAAAQQMHLLAQVVDHAHQRPVSQGRRS